MICFQDRSASCSLLGWIVIAFWMFVAPGCHNNQDEGASLPPVEKPQPRTANREGTAPSNNQLTQLAPLRPNAPSKAGSQHQNTKQGAKQSAKQAQLKRLWKQGALAKHQGNYEGARKAWKAALALAPNHPGFQEAIHKLAKASQRSTRKTPTPTQRPAPTSTPAPKKPAGYRKRLRGSNPVRIVNPFDSRVTVFLRTGSKGAVYDRGVDFRVRPQKSATVYAPNGHYDIFFAFSDKPDQLFQGDSFEIDYFGVEITLEMVTNGNFGMHEVF